MADISIVQAHSLSQEKARAAAAQVADKLARDYDLACKWEGDVLRFERSGVQGALTLHEQKAEMKIRLGFLMGAFSSAIEAKVAEKMRKVFGAASGRSGSASSGQTLSPRHRLVSGIDSASGSDPRV